MVRGCVYVDGFNLYHAIDDLKKPYLKWLNLRRLSEIFARGHATQVDRVVFCSAFFPGNFEKKKRHEAYNAALKANGVEVILGHTTKEPKSCLSCHRRWDEPREKETDINVALALFDDARKDLFDVAFLVTADTDQAATLRFMLRSFPTKKVIVVTPPGRQKSKHLRDLSHANIQITEEMIDLAVMRSSVAPDVGRLIVRPSTYEPPAGWVHPDDRP